MEYGADLVLYFESTLLLYILIPLVVDRGRKRLGRGHVGKD